MAELPHIGKHCSLSSCRRLDFTPHHCRECGEDFCSDHRLSHGCDVSKVYDAATATPAEAPLRPYVCSLQDCSKAESIKVVCPYCQLNFCLAHRHASDHWCSQLPVKINHTEQALKNIQAAIDRHIPREEQGGVAPAVAAPKNKPVKVLTEAERKKADRVAAMKCRLKASSDIPKCDQMVVFAEGEGGRREAVMCDKRWTVGRALDSMAKALQLLTVDPASGLVARAFERDSDEPLDMAASVGDALTDMGTVVVRVVQI